MGQNFDKLPYQKITFLETCYLSILGLLRPIIYRPDELFQLFSQIFHLPINGKKNCEKNGKCNQDDYLQVLSKSSWTTFKKTFKAFSALGSVT